MATSLEPQAHEYIHYALDGGERLNALIDDLLEYSRLDWQSKPLIAIDMNEAVAKSIIILKVQVEENDVNIVIDPLPSVLADETQIVLLMQNLLSNAIKFHSRSLVSRNTYFCDDWTRGMDH